MTWVKIDDSFYDHPKFSRVGPLGIALWVCGLAYCNRNLTDGFISEGAAERLIGFHHRDPSSGERAELATTTCPDRNGVTNDVTNGGRNIAGIDLVRVELAIALLLRAGLWVEVEGGFQVENYLEFQSSRAKVLHERELAASRQQVWRNRNGVTNGVTNDVTNGGRNGPVTHAPIPIPTPDSKPLNLPPPSPAAPAEGVQVNFLPPTPTTDADTDATSPGKASRSPLWVRKEWDATFDAHFWPAYPRRVGRAEARKAWMKLIGPQDGEAECAKLVTLIVKALRHDCAEEWRDRTTDKIPHAATWLNQRRFLDAVPA